MADRFDVIVVGIGAMGAAACRHLAGRGVRVLGLEQHDLHDERIASYGESRVIRMCYYEHPDYVPLLHRTYELWSRLEEESGRRMLHLTGALYIGWPDRELIGGALEAAVRHDLPHERLELDELTRRFPQFRPRDEWVGLYEPKAGFIVPPEAILGHVEVGVRHGLTVKTGERVVEWSADAQGVSVTTSRESYSADRLVFCSGGWTNELVGRIGVELTVSRQVLGWVRPRVVEPFAIGTFPIFGIDDDDGPMVYGFPMMPGEERIKVAHHRHGHASSIDALDRTPHAADEDDFRPILRECVPDADGPLDAMRVCHYTSTPDCHFIIDRHPEHDRVALAAGFSGHGLKFAPVVGEALADLTLDGRSELPIGFLSLARFADS